MLQRQVPALLPPTGLSSPSQTRLAHVGIVVMEHWEGFVASSAIQSALPGRGTSWRRPVAWRAARPSASKTFQKLYNEFVRRGTLLQDDCGVWFRSQCCQAASALFCHGGASSKDQNCSIQKFRPRAQLQLETEALLSSTMRLRQGRCVQGDVSTASPAAPALTVARCALCY